MVPSGQEDLRGNRRSSRRYQWREMFPRASRPPRSRTHILEEKPFWGPNPPPARRCLTGFKGRGGAGMAARRGAPGPAGCSVPAGAAPRSPRAAAGGTAALQGRRRGVSGAGLTPSLTLPRPPASLLLLHPSPSTARPLPLTFHRPPCIPHPSSIPPPPSLIFHPLLLIFYRPPCIPHPSLLVPISIPHPPPLSLSPIPSPSMVQRRRWRGEMTSHMTQRARMRTAALAGLAARRRCRPREQARSVRDAVVAIGCDLLLVY